ncbi:MAG: O-antigen ligase family protein [Marmoricola sp.]
MTGALSSRRVGLLGLIVPVAVLTGLVALRAPVLSLVAVCGAGVLAVLVLQLEWAVLLYVAAEPFNDYLRLLDPAALKGLGALVFLAWLLRLATRTRPLALRHLATAAAAVLFVALLASTAWHPHGSDSVVVATRYVSYLAILVVLVDTMRTTLPPRRVMATFVLSCTAAAVVGLGVFLTRGGRAGGPVSDPNDFAFFLLCAFALALALGGPPARRPLGWQLAAGVLLVGMLATFSRGAVLGLLAVLAYGLVVRLIRPAAVIVVAVLAVVGISAIVLADPALVRSSVEAKQHIAGQNVDDRYATWAMAAEMTADSPLLGQGPGGFKAEYDHYVGTRALTSDHFDVAHEMYLDVASELGLLGAGAFVTMLAAGALAAGRGARSGTPRLARGVVAGFAGTLIAACFLTEQYYLPIWLLTALGVALDPLAAAGSAAAPGPSALEGRAPAPTAASRGV